MDDIQGAAGVTLAGLINALKITGGKLKDQRILFLGAGSAAIGLADLIVSAVVEKDKIPAEKAREQIRMFDTLGLVVAGRLGLAAHKLPYAHKLPAPANHSIISTRRASARRSENFCVYVTAVQGGLFIILVLFLATERIRQ